MKKVVLALVIGSLVFQPLSAAFATVTPAIAEDGVDQTVNSPDPDPAIIDDDPTVNADQFYQSWDGVAMLVDQEVSGNCLQISPDDQIQITNKKVDIRVTDYLLSLCKPIEFGGDGFSRIKVNRILKNYTSNGAGRFDREGVNAVDDSGDIVSGHNRGQAVDVSEVGEVTCKLVFKRHLGGSTTEWQKPLPVKVAWQSVDGIKQSPTPTSQSILGAAGDMSAQSILAYLNASGEMDYYIDFVKGLDMKTIIGYVGANIYLKSFGVNKILTDPFADGMLHALGGAVLTKALPGLPEGIATGNGNDDARVAFAKSRLEQGLNLPPGSLHDYGWDNILQGAGRRHLETSLGLPNGYFDNHTLDEAMNLDNVKVVIDHFNRGDDGLNLISGTIDAMKNKDPNSFKMAGVTILESALKLPDDQKKILETAVRAGKVPDGIKLDGAPVGSTVSLDDLKNIFSSDKSKQKEVEASLKKIGLSIVNQAAQKAVKNKYSGLTAQLLTDLLNPGSTVKLGDLQTSVGASTMGIQIGINDSGLDKGRVDIKSFITRHAAEIAKTMNADNSITDPTTQITAEDIRGLYDKKSLTLAEKLGSVSVDKAVGWDRGTTYQVITNKKSLSDAFKEAFSNFVGKTLGLDATGISLEGDIQENFGYATLSSRLGIDQKLLRAAANFTDLAAPQQLGDALARQKFKINNGQDLTTLQGDASFWDNPENQSGWRAIDIALGTTVGTVQSYLEGNLTTAQLARKTAQGGLANFTADKIYDYFGISSQYRLDDTQINALIKVFAGKDDQTLADAETARQAILQLLGRSVDEKANFGKDTFIKYITDPSGENGVNLLLDQGIRLVAQSLGANLQGYSYDDFQAIANLLNDVFGGKGFSDSFQRSAGMSVAEAEKLRQELDALLAKNPNSLSSEQVARLRELEGKAGLRAYRQLFSGVSDYLLQATGIPANYRRDAEAFLRGDWRTGIAAFSFAQLLPQINQFMPADNQLTYADMRNALILEDPIVINARVNQIYQDAGVNGQDVANDDYQATYQIARRQLMEEAQKNIEYRMSDSLLRKIDPSIPVGFSRIMFSGTTEERGQLLQNFAFGKLDVELARLSPLYQPGMLKALYEGKIGAATTDKIMLGLLNQSGISFGPFSTEFVSSFYQFTRAKARGDFFTNDTKYGAMWGFFDHWLTDNLGLGALPDGLAKSIYFSAQNGWNLDADLKDGKGQVVVQSLNNLAKDFLINRLSYWGDQKFGLPVGSVYKIYQLTTTFQSADHALAVAHASGATDKVSAAQGAENAARAALILFAIELALNACSTCQAFFGSVDQAIAAPPGFTQALVLGVIANSLGLGPTGIYIAAAIYLFGVYKVEYLCPTPPQDVYAIANFDSPEDQNDFGVPYTDLPADYNLISASPAPGQNPFDWDDTVPFSDGNNQKLWMGWSRYYVGKLLDATMSYGEQHLPPWQPLQVITYRRANAEFFASRVPGAFGEWSANNDTIGLGFSQASTKTTDWVHTGFGGLY